MSELLCAAWRARAGPGMARRGEARPGRAGIRKYKEIRKIKRRDDIITVFANYQKHSLIEEDTFLRLGDGSHFDLTTSLNHSDYEDSLIAAIDLARALENIKNRKSKRIAKLIIAGNSQREISRIINKDRHSVRIHLSSPPTTFFKFR